MGKLSDLIKDMGSMTDDELREHVRQMRHAKYVEKPATKKRVEETVKAEKNKTVRGLPKLIDGMSDEDKAALLKLLEEQ